MNNRSAKSLKHRSVFGSRMVAEFRAAREATTTDTGVSGGGATKRCDGSRREHEGSKRIGALGWLRWGRVALLAAVPAAFVSWSSPASAQGWLADRRYTEGPGIRTGDLELHPGIGGEVGYDSNWFLRSHNEGPTIANGGPAGLGKSGPPADAAVFRITPSFYVSTLGQQRTDSSGMTRTEPRVISFRGGVSATGRAFIGRETSRQHNVSIASDARLDINQGRPIGVGIFGG
ncbi:MAG TPA: hypothetical protein VM580_10045, partial [Labilithrix sp.]|nr:hypothetical protein [Labilithrix sp.]